MSKGFPARNAENTKTSLKNMSPATYRVIKSKAGLPSTPGATNAIKTADNGQPLLSHSSSGANIAGYQTPPKANKGQPVNRPKKSQNEDVFDEPYPACQLVDHLTEKTEITDIKNRHYFLKIAIPLSLSYWVLESFIHYYWYGELEPEIIPSDFNDLWMRISIFILLITFGLFADYKSKRSIDRSILKNQTDNISRAKKQWELVIDTLPQLVIAMDANAKIIRVNRTVETWGIGKVNKVDGLYVADFLKCLNEKYVDDSWTSDWSSVWQQIKNQDMLERKVEKKQIGKTYQYTLRKVSDFDCNKDQCYAVLIIDDITTRQDVEESLKTHAQDLEKKVNDRTLKLKQANTQLEHELQAKKAANVELKEAQNCRQALLRVIFTTQENERKRIACELHDSVGQSLGATKFKLEELLIDKQHVFGTDYNEFTGVVKKLQSTIQEIRHISMDLRPALLDDLGILVTLNWFCREFGDTYIGLSIKKIINVDESNISEDNKVVIFRIVQEAMNNIAKHANATNIVIELSHSGSDLLMSISDDGCGFNKEKLVKKQSAESNKQDHTPGCNYGLSSMRERAESTNGEFSIKTIPNVGTCVSIMWKTCRPDLSA